MKQTAIIASESQVENKTTKKITKKAFDTMVAEILTLKESKKAIDTRLKELTAIVEGMYKKPASERETISGNEYEMSKTPINRGRNSYSAEIVHTFMSKIPAEQRTGLIVVKEEVDAHIMDKLAKAGILTQKDLDMAREDKWTFSSKFAKKVSAVIQDNIITFNPRVKK